MHTKDLIEGIESGDIDIEEHISKQLGRIKKYNKKYKAFISVKSDLSEVRGLSVAVKDNIAAKGLKATASSRVLENYTAPYSATAVERIESKTAIIGKTACDPFGTGGSGITSDFGVTKNPIDPTRVPGGSSGGNGVALALNMCDLALGTDTFGSVRAPAAFCGIVGFRPTYGLVSRYGLLDLCMSMDTIGPMARDVYGAAYLLSMISGYDEKDCTTQRTKNVRYHELLDRLKVKEAVAVIPQFGDIDKSVESVFEEAAGLLEEMGVGIKRIEVKGLQYSVPAYYLTMFAEFSSAMQKYDGLKYGRQKKSYDLFALSSKSRGRYFNPELKRRVLLGTYITLKEYREKWYTLAQKAVSFVRGLMDKLLYKNDFIITPTMPVLPWKIGELTSPVENYMMDILTGPPAIAGLPAISIPCGKAKNLPVGVQIIGKRFQDLKVLQLAHEFEKIGGKVW
jgi:aspartyl-tRNA(Asn)/glutamyl-tRNA(Gln) amidotransferase subunit A